eukprot:scaffold36319_cov53-Phaeocystis_antarctica.AAC.9
MLQRRRRRLRFRLPLENAAELKEVDRARSVDIGRTEHVAQLRLGRALPQLCHHRAQLDGVDHAVAVLVKAFEDGLHLVVRQQADGRPRRKRHAGQQRAAVHSRHQRQREDGGNC